MDRLRPAKSAAVVPNHSFPEPPPIVVDEEDEYEVEAILNAKMIRRKFKYLVKWKGYPDSENSWEPLENIKNASEAIAKFHQKHPEAPPPAR